jgi:uncharacterized protein YjdB
VTAATTAIPAGQTVQLTATALDRNGSPVAGQTFQWSSGNTAVATVTPTGLVSGLAEGTAEIRATIEGGVAGGVTITVTPSLIGGPLAGDVTASALRPT